MRIAIALLSLACAAGAARADYYVGDNHSWTLTCNASGFQLKSRDPDTRFVEAGANSSVSDGLETIYLGRSCDAEHAVLGKGKWCWANGGLYAEFKCHRIGFPRLELICANSNQTTCGC